jgi:hypothetical protein
LRTFANLILEALGEYIEEPSLDSREEPGWGKITKEMGSVP